MGAERDIVVKIAQYIEAQTGIAYNEVTYFQLESRLVQLVKNLGYRDLHHLWQTVSVNGWPTELREALLDISTNNETSFFRDTSLFEALKLDFLPQWLSLHAPKTVRIWSAASSTGQEAYSIAMLFEEHKNSSGHFNYEIMATDLSERVLKRARQARYTQLEVSRGLPLEYKDRYLQALDDSGEGLVWEIKPQLKSRVFFKRLNLVDAWPADLGNFDLVLCRNVLIYQNLDKKVEVLKKISRHLNPGAFLILGGAESLVGLSNDFSQVQFGKAIFYQSRT